MPLLDYFNPPLNRTHPWRSFHGAWAATIARLLNQGLLPEGYYALPLIDRDEVDAEDDLEVHVMTADGDPRLMAAIELVSPRNKDRPQARAAFVSKCVGYLQKGCSVIVVDTVTTRRADLIAEILARLDAESALAAGELSATALRTVAGDGDDRELQVWRSPMALGEPLPTLPLWIDNDLSVRLDLDASYRTTCNDLRIRQAG